MFKPKTAAPNPADKKTNTSEKKTNTWQNSLRSYPASSKKFEELDDRATIHSEISTISKNVRPKAISNFINEPNQDWPSWSVQSLVQVKEPHKNTDKGKNTQLYKKAPVFQKKTVYMTRCYRPAKPSDI